MGFSALYEGSEWGGGGGGGRCGGRRLECATITHMEEPVLNEFGAQETNLAERPRSPVVCMLINSHDLFNGVAVRKGCEAWRGCREANTGLAPMPSTEMERRFSFQAKPRRS